MGLHSHQPVGNFDHVFEAATKDCYQPFLELLSRYPQIRMSLHFSGVLIEWIRVHRLPDHVRFTHQRHVLSGVACRECHGAVEEMQAVRQVSPLSMGWCLECHRREQAKRPVELARLTDCTTCHK